VIISDATALIVLINIDRFELFKMIFSSIIMPQEVYDEVTVKPSAKKFIDAEIKAGFLSIENYEDKKTFKEINFILDKGESAAIALAIEKKLPLIIDEKKGRRFAQRNGIEIIGLVGILKFLYVNKSLTKKEVLEIIESLNQSNFRISEKLMKSIVRK
jgi:predicted nucleic acid-binding protein